MKEKTEHSRRFSWKRKVYRTQKKSQKCKRVAGIEESCKSYTCISADYWIMMMTVIYRMSFTTVYASWFFSFTITVKANARFKMLILFSHFTQWWQCINNNGEWTLHVSCYNRSQQNPAAKHSWRTIMPKNGHSCSPLPYKRDQSSGRSDKF